MQAPLFDSIQLSAAGWFNLSSRSPLSALPCSPWRMCAARWPLCPVVGWGADNLLYFLVLWPFVLGNFAKALTGFTDQRLLTEGVILVNAVIVTVLILLLPRETQAETGLAGVNLRGWPGDPPRFCCLRQPPGRPWRRWPSARLTATRWPDTHRPIIASARTPTGKPCPS